MRVHFVSAIAAVMMASTAFAAGEISKVEDNPTNAGMTVAIDKATGKLRPATNAEIRELSRMVAQRILKSASTPAPEVVLPNGSIAVDATNDLQNMVVAVVGGDGNLRFTCVHDAAGIEHMAVTPALEEK
jgi:hypothetical protein